MPDELKKARSAAAYLMRVIDVLTADDADPIKKSVWEETGVERNYPGAYYCDSCHAMADECTPYTAPGVAPA